MQSKKCAASNIVEDVCRLYPDVHVDHVSSLRVSRRADAEMLGFEVDPVALIPHLLLIDDGIAGSEWNLVSIVQTLTVLDTPRMVSVIVSLIVGV